MDTFEFDFETVLRELADGGAQGRVLLFVKLHIALGELKLESGIRLHSL